MPDCFCDMQLNWSGNDNGGYPYFAIGANNLCNEIPDCVYQSENFELSLDQFYYSFPVYSPQECDSVSIVENSFPYQFKLSQPYPNPFNPVTTLTLEIPFDRKLDIRVYDLLGNEVDVISKNLIYNTGTHQIQWDGSGYSSGVYFFKITDGMDLKIRKMILLK